MRRLPIGTIKDIVQLLAKQESLRQIKRKVPKSLSTLSMVKQACEKSGMDLKQIAELPEREIELIVYGNAKTYRLVPDFEMITKTLAIDSKITLKKLYQLYRLEEGENAYSYERYCSLYREWLEECKTYLNQDLEDI